MEVSYLMLATYAEMAGDGKVLICSGDLDTLRVPTAAFPASSGLPLYLVGRLSFPEHECGRDHQGRIEFVAPDGTVLNGTDQPFQPPPSHLGRPSKAGFIMIMGMVFPMPGTYTIRLLVGGTVVKTLPVYVEQVLPEAR
jgi:hypothetical protein